MSRHAHRPDAADQVPVQALIGTPISQHQAMQRVVAHLHDQAERAAALPPRVVAAPDDPESVDPAVRARIALGAAQAHERHQRDHLTRTERTPVEAHNRRARALRRGVPLLLVLALATVLPPWPLLLAPLFVFVGLAVYLALQVEHSSRWISSAGERLERARDSYDQAVDGLTRAEIALAQLSPGDELLPWPPPPVPRSRQIPWFMI